MTNVKTTTKSFTRRRTSKNSEPLVQPFLKWAGGKRQLLSEIRPLIPEKIKCYFEPFLGGGAVFFDIQPKRAIINDFNMELINCYKVIKETPQELLNELSEFENTKEFFYKIREQDRTKDFLLLTPVERAARIIYLNKTCFNGLFRVNSRNEFNVPFGNYKNPTFADSAVIFAIHKYLNKSKITFLQDDFAKSVKKAKKDDFVYFDPPYDPVSDTSSFTGYSLNGFNKDEQLRLQNVCDDLTEKGVKFMLSNSDTDFIREVYRSYNIHTVKARRSINSVASNRGKINEILVTNYNT